MEPYSDLAFMGIAVRFPSLNEAPGVMPWSPNELDEWAAGLGRDKQAVHAARFILGKWNPSFEGVMVFASSKPTELSWQMPKLKHGAFSFSVLEALGGKADFDKDKRITLSEIVAFVTGRVKSLTDDKQHPFLPPGSFDPGLVLAHL